MYILSFIADIFKTATGSPWRFCHPDLASFRKTNLASLGLLLQAHTNPPTCIVVQKEDSGLFEG
jgi:hypothetical protein